MDKKVKKPADAQLSIDSGERLAVRPDTFAFALFAATLPLYSPNMGIFIGFAQGGSLVGYFVFSMVISSFALSGAIMAYAVRHHGWQCFGIRLLGAFTLMYLVGVLSFFTLIQLPAAMPALAVAAGAATGMGLVPLCVAWGSHFSMNLRNALLWCAITCLVASLLSWGLTVFPRQMLWAVLPLAVIVGAATPFALMARGRLRMPQPDLAHMGEADTPLPEGATGKPAAGAPGLFASIRRIVSIIWLPFAGLLVYAFLTSVHKLYVFELLDSEFIGGALAALCIIPFCFLRTEKPLLPVVYRVIVPVFAAVLMVLGSFPVDSAPQYIGAVGSYVFFVFLALFALASILAVTHAGEFSPGFVYGFALLCGTAITLFGLVQAQVIAITDDFGPIMWVVTSLFFAVILAHLGIDSWKSLSTPEPSTAPSAASLQESLQARCGTVAREYGLSERETEILGYLSRGHSPTYVAKTLVISVSTARSHVRNIYRKVGVGSREELLQLIDREG